MVKTWKFWNIQIKFCQSVEQTYTQLSIVYILHNYFFVVNLKIFSYTDVASIFQSWASYSLQCGLHWFKMQCVFSIPHDCV